MEKKDTLSSCSESEEQQMQLIQDKSKESCMVSFQRLHSHLKRLSNNDLKGSRTENGFGRAFATLFGQDFETFTGTMFLNMDQLQKQLDNNEFQEIGSMASFKVLETQFQMFIKSKIYLNDEYIVMTRNYFLQYTQLDIPEFRETLVQFMEYVKKSIDERALHKREHDSRVNERQMQTTMEKVDTSKALDASSVIIESNGTESQKQDTSSRSGNDADIRPIYDEEPKAEVQMTTNNNVSAKGQQHTEQPESNNEGEVDQNADQCYDTGPLPAKLTDNRTTELSNQLLESENVCLKKTVAQCQKDFAKLEAHCINLELQMENNVLKSGQQSQFLKEKSNEAKVKNDIDVTETINIELEHSVAKLLAENEQLHKEKEHLKQTYKDLFDSIKRTRVQTKNQNDSLMAQLNKKSNENADVLAQIQKKGFAIAALKNELRKLIRSSKEDITNQCESEQALDVSAEKTDISENRASRNFDLMMDKWCLLKITLQALFLNVQMTSVHISSGLVLHQMMSDHNSSDLAPQRQEIQDVVPTVEKTDSSQQGFEFLFSPLLEEYYNPAHGHAEDNNNDQAPNASTPVFAEETTLINATMLVSRSWKFINPFCTRVQEIGDESSSRNIDYYRYSLNFVAGGNFLDKMPHDCVRIIESKSKVHNSRNKPVVAKVSSSSSTPGISPDVSELKDMVKALLLDKKS
ncbi:hypothetical protein Tco_1499809 [Tanacetum coccineum]